MHVDDLPAVIPRERFRWMEVKVRVLVDTQDELLTGKEYAKKGVRAYFDAAYEIDVISTRSHAIGVCERDHVITEQEAKDSDCGYCQAEAEDWAERRYER